MSRASRPGAAKTKQPFDWMAFVLASAVAAAILLPLVLVPQWLSKQARWDALRSHVAEIGQLAATVVDGDLHSKLLNPENYSDDLYARAVAPLVRVHSANPNIYYLYTMVNRGGVPYFVLDTAKSPDLRTDRKLVASDYMERFDIRAEYEDHWLNQIASGKTYVTPNYEQDNYGTFLTAHVPLYDSQGHSAGFLGVDFDLQYYFTQEARFRAIAIGSLLATALAALGIGYVFALYFAATQHRMRTLYESSIRDGLTHLLNRRGAVDAVQVSLRQQSRRCAALLIDIDGLKLINDTRGHVTGDAAISRTASAIRDSVRKGDICARLGGDEFFVFAPNCDEREATKIAERILALLRQPSMPLVGRQ
jgi:diguanylate cyclase (GGDEF)-like protein